MNVDELTRQIQREQAEKIVAQANQWPVGSRWSPVGHTDIVTVVGFDCDLGEPLFISDDCQQSDQWMTLSDAVAGAEGMYPAEDSRAMADQACSVARGCGVPQHLTLWDTPTSADQVLAATAFREANRAMLAADRAAQDATAARAVQIAVVVSHCDGNQSAAARLLGMDQSRISRAISSLPDTP